MILARLGRWWFPSLDARHVALTGIPRSGTTLCCRLLNQLPDMVALHEPLDVARIAAHRSRRGRMREICRSFERYRHSLSDSGTAPSKVVEGTVPDNPFADWPDDTGERVRLDGPGELRLEAPLSAGGVLVVKQPAVFMALLGEVARGVRTYAVIRNPLGLLGSWASLPLPLREGRAPVAASLSPELARRLEGLPHREERQIELLGWFFERVACHLDDEHVIRYEDLVRSQGRTLSRIDASAGTLDEVLVSRDEVNPYDHEGLQRMGQRLLDTEGAFWDFYSRDSVRAVLQAARSRDRRPSTGVDERRDVAEENE